MSLPQSIQSTTSTLHPLPTSETDQVQTQLELRRFEVELKRLEIEEKRLNLFDKVRHDGTVGVRGSIYLFSGVFILSYIDNRLTKYFGGNAFMDAQHVLLLAWTLVGFLAMYFTYIFNIKLSVAADLGKTLFTIDTKKD